MEKLPTRKRTMIIKLFLSGFSYDEIAAKCGVSKGTVANVVSDLKAGRFPEAGDVSENIELLRELSLDLKRSGLAPVQCAIGLAALKRINECGLEPADIDRWSLILKEVGNEDQAQEFVKAVYGIQEIQKKTGLSLEDLDNKAHELEKKAASLEPMAKQHDNLKKQIAELTRQHENLARSVASLEDKYKLLNPRVKDLEKSEQDLSHQIKDMKLKAEKAEVAIATLNGEKQKLLDIGLSPEALAEFSQKVRVIAKCHGIAPEELRERLLKELETLDKGLGLEAQYQSLQLELERQEQTASVSRKESESLKAVIAGLKQEKADLEASIKETRETVSREIAKITLMARDTVNQVVRELRRGHDEVLEEIQRLTTEAIEVGKEVGRSEEMLQANEWLNTLLALARGEEGLEGKQVRAIALLILRGTAAWLKHEKADTLTFSSILFALENLIRELEQWKA